MSTFTKRWFTTSGSLVALAAWIAVFNYGFGGAPDNNYAITAVGLFVLAWYMLLGYGVAKIGLKLIRLVRPHRG